MELREFQREDIDQILAHGLRALIASEPGTGKTIVAIKSLTGGYPQSFPAVVVCPASVTRNWARELKTWAPGVRVVLIETGNEPVPKITRNTVILISWALLDAWWADLIHLGIRTIIADEAHFARNEETLRSQALYRLSQRTPYMLLLTGTPIVNQQQELVALKLLLGENPLMIRRILEDVAPDIPPKSRSYVPIELRPAHRADYDNADHEFEEWLLKEREIRRAAGLSDIEVERTLAAEALTKVGYLRRLVGEYKVPAAVDWIARAVRLGEPVVVFLEHQNVLNKLTKSLRKQRIRFGVVDGSTPPRVRQDLVDGFQAHKFPVFIGTRAAKEGITLHAARHLLFIERFFTSADEEQAEDRIRRIGQRHATTIWFLHAGDTIDDRVDQIVKIKRKIVRTAIGSADTEETPVGNVMSLLSTWNDHVHADVGKPLSLGLGEPLPPLPSPRDTHAVSFYGDRWTLGAAVRWCRMNGYEVHSRVPLVDRLKVVIHPPQFFVPQTFTVFPVSKDIRLILGRRLSKVNERQIQKAMRESQKPRQSVE